MKLTKVTLIAAVALTSTAALAKRTESKNSKVVIRNSTTSYTFRDKRAAVADCEAKLAQKLNDVENNLNSNFPKGYEYECGEVEVLTETKFDIVTYVGSMYRGWAAVDHTYTIDLTVKCVPRKLSEKALYAMAQRCEENPVEACFDEKLLAKLDAIGTTKFTYIHKGSTCKPLN